MEKLQRTIKTITSKEVKTKFGLKQKYNIQFDNDKWMDSFVGIWNQDWLPRFEAGDEVVIEFAQEQVKEREWEGKTYYTLQAPLEARFQGIGREEFNSLEVRVTHLEGIMLEEEKRDAKIEEEVGTEKTQEKKDKEEEIKIEELGF